ncbi:hypothetical protein N0B44_25020 [Roseibacterium beibuensis]|uniref:Uncharacterized protein n=1 Tax=[Roseibacterium] beibuensis TaxID=1193142 RepID=A0ABP9LNK3_9RHOB|nr:hypothetical protein [Roseibacterium beibuensis]MCS6626185.1 hypothetical protein [Roseibacterium beibuensis]
MTTDLSAYADLSEADQVILGLAARFWLPGSFAFRAEALDGLTPA